MPDPEVPAEAPPSYQQATGSSSSSQPPAASGSSNNNQTSATNNASSTGKTHLEVPGQESSSIPAAYRRSMEDELRPLPEGWVRTFDPQNQHQFFVDTTRDPPRSIWVHPYDDDEYLSTLPSEERERIEQESMNRGSHPSKADIMASHTDDEDDSHPSSSSELPPRPDGKGKGKDNRSFGRKFKDKVTGTTHEEREQERKKRAEYEHEMYQKHLAIRHAMGEAMRTGQPQLVGRDGDGKEIYVEPPTPPTAMGGYPGAYGSGYTRGANMYDPYGRGGVYTTPSARYIRPPNPYSRPMGRGFGGGYGLPLALGGGLLGGMLIGDAMF